MKRVHADRSYRDGRTWQPACKCGWLAARPVRTREDTRTQYHAHHTWVGWLLQARVRRQRSRGGAAQAAQ